LADRQNIQKGSVAETRSSRIADDKLIFSAELFRLLARILFVGNVTGAP
jgi:hypothetical protein